MQIAPYLGEVVQSGINDDVYERFMHPHTQAMLGAVPVPTRRSNDSDSASCAGHLVACHHPEEVNVIRRSVAAEQERTP